MEPLSYAVAAAVAGFIIGQGGHQQDGFRDTGCDPAAQVAVVSERTGQVLYYMNSTCPAGSGATDTVAAPAEPVEAEPENGNGNGASNGNGPNGNASANNGNGGNYAWTGHTDNKRGNGRR